jgi:hypothetical protein
MRGSRILVRTGPHPFPLRRRGLALLFYFAGCAPAPAPPWFEEVALERGLDWTHVVAPERRFHFPEIMGGGVGLIDYDGDGALDVFLVQSGDLLAPGPVGADRLFRNLGGARFVEAGPEAGGRDEGYGMGCAIGDADQDGDADVYVTNVGPNELFRVEGGTLRGAGAEAGVADPGWGTSAVWLDHDADGDLDLFVVNYVRWAPERELVCRAVQGGRDYCSPNNYDAPARDVLYENLGRGRFRDASEAAGLKVAFGNGLGVVASDFDADGRIDVFVANDQMPNQLWHNLGEGRFEDRALFAGCAVNESGAAEAGMGVAAFDAEGDGDLDLFVTHLRDETNTFFENEKGLFTDRTARLALGGPSLPFTGFGVGAQDFDRDGELDLYVANGAVTRNRLPYRADAPYSEPNQVFRGVRAASGARTFVEVLPRGGTESELVGNSRAAAFGDLDEDGALDVVVVDNGERVKLLLGRPANGRWIGLDVRERNGASAEGARVWLSGQTRELHRTVASGGSYCASNDPRLLCGLGDDPGPVRVRVRWVDGTEQHFGPLAIGRKHVLARATGR